jgi:hypothetical protein
MWARSVNLPIVFSCVTSLQDFAAITSYQGVVAHGSPPWSSPRAAGVRPQQVHGTRQDLVVAVRPHDLEGQLVDHRLRVRSNGGLVFQSGAFLVASF